MANITFLCPPLTGHITPLHKLATYLKQDGHSIAFVHFFEKYPFDNEFDLYPIKNNFKEIVSGTELNYSKVYDLKESYLRFFESVYHETLETCKTIETDLFVIDHFFQIGSLIADELFTSYLYAYSTPDPFMIEFPDSTTPPIDKIDFIVRKKGFESFKNLAVTIFGKPIELYPLSPTGNICFSTETITFNEERDARFGLLTSICDHKIYPVSFIGPFLNESPITENDEMLKNEIKSFQGRKIFISFGTVWTNLIQLKDMEEKLTTIIRNVLEALTTPDTLFVYSGSKKILDQVLNQSPANFNLIHRDFLHQSYLLDAFDLAVFHGGYNSFVECVTNSVPMLCVPMGWDQGNIAKIILEQNLGDRINLSHHSQEEIKVKAEKVIHSPQVKENLRNIAKDFSQHNGEKLGCLVIEKCLEKIHKTDVLSTNHVH